MLVETNIEKCR